MARFDGIPVSAELKPRFKGNPIGATSAGIQGSGGAIEPAPPSPDLSTHATRTLPELFTSGLLKGKDPVKVAQFAALAALTPNEQELGQIATSIFPEIGMQSDEMGNVILADNKTGVQTVINRPGLSTTDLAQLFGIGSAFTPGARIGTNIVGQGFKQGAKQVAKGGAVSGGTQAAIETGQGMSGGEMDISDIALAAVLQPGVQTVGEKLATTAVRGAKGTIPEKTAQVIKAGERAGVDVHTTDVVPPDGIVGGLVRQFAERIPFLGTGGMRGKQSVQRKNAIQEFAEKIPPVDDRAIISSIQQKRDTIKTAASNRYERIKSEMDAAGAVPTTSTITKIDEAIADLSRPGKVVDDSTIKDLQDLKTALQNPQSFSLLRENRTYMSDLINKTDPAGRSQLPTNSKRLLTQIRGAMSKDMDEFVRTNSPDNYFKYKQADQIYAEEANLLTKSRLKNVLDKGDVTPEQYKTLLFSSKPSEIQTLYRSMNNEGRGHARNAVLNHVVDKAGGLENMTPATINRELKKAMPQINAFFRGEEKEQLKGFQRLLEATKRADEAKAVTPTGQAMQTTTAVAAGGAAFAKSPAAIVALLLSGGIAGSARIYETRPVRNLMVRLGNAQKGSKVEKAIIDNLLTEISAASQVTESPVATSSVTTNF